MNISELRAGNWVDVFGFKTTISQITLGAFINEGIDGVNQIPLTEEIIQKAGFKGFSMVNNYNNTGHFHEYEKNRIFVRVEIINKQVKDIKVMHFKRTVLRYVHELQNIYCNFTNEELIFEL